MVKKRLDLLLVERGLAETRQRAQALILAGDVLVNQQKVEKAGTPVPEDATISIRTPLKYVGRGGLKLEAALEAFQINVQAKVCADIGASTGGFTDVLLQRGAIRVYAIDVGYGQLAWKLRTDRRVVVMDRINIRHLERLPEPIDLATMDVSFISLTLVLPVVKHLLGPWGQAVALVKPQFEAGRRQVGKGGIVRDPLVRRSVILQVAAHAMHNGWRVLGITQSPITGADGNIEYLIHLTTDLSQPDIQLAPMLETLD